MLDKKTKKKKKVVTSTTKEVVPVKKIMPGNNELKTTYESYQRKTTRKYRSKTGRPSTYKPEYCKDIVEYMSTGKSLTQWCADHNIWRERAMEWMQVNQDFRNAYFIAKVKCEKVWEQIVDEAIFNPKVNYGVLKMKMTNRFNWREQTHSTSQNINVNADMDIEKVKLLNDEIEVKEF